MEDSTPLYNKEFYLAYLCGEDVVLPIPDGTPALFSEVAKPNEILPWKQPQGAHDAYNTGDKVTHNGKTWVCVADSNVYEPGVWGWDEV